MNFDLTPVGNTLDDTTTVAASFKIDDLEFFQ